MNPQDKELNSSSPEPQETLLERHISNIHEEMRSSEEKRHGRRRIVRSEMFSLIVMIILGIGIGLTLSQFVFRPYRVVGTSMIRTLEDGDRLIVNKLGRSWSSLTGDDYIPKRGEIVVFHSPFNEELLVKRVIALPGERVVVTNGSITVYNDQHPNGFDPDEGQYYEANLPTYTTGNIDIVVTEGHLFVSGDNRTPEGSSDSRNELGLVPVDNLVGDVIMRLMPLSDARFF